MELHVKLALHFQSSFLKFAKSMQCNPRQVLSEGVADLEWACRLVAGFPVRSFQPATPLLNKARPITLPFERRKDV